MKILKIRMLVIIIILLILLSTLCYGRYKEVSEFTPDDPGTWSQIQSKEEIQQITNKELIKGENIAPMQEDLKGEAIKHKYSNNQIQFNNLPQQGLGLQDDWMTHNGERIFNFKDTQKPHTIDYKDGDWEIDGSKGAKGVEEKDEEEERVTQIPESDEIENIETNIFGQFIENYIFSDIGFSVQEAQYFEIGNDNFKNVQNLIHSYQTKETWFSYADASNTDNAQTGIIGNGYFGDNRITADRTEEITTDNIVLTQVEDLKIIFQ